VSAAKKARTLPADVYDTLELSALAYGGIGHGQLYTEFGNRESGPCCALGHAYLADVGRDMENALLAAKIDGAKNDAAFRADEGRISFAEWCRRLNVVRGAR
jgi:hypothetical protein